MSDSPKYYIINKFGSCDLNKGPIKLEVVTYMGKSNLEMYQNGEMFHPEIVITPYDSSLEEIKAFNAKCEKIAKKKRLRCERVPWEKEQVEPKDEELNECYIRQKQLNTCLSEIIAFNRISKEQPVDQAFATHVHLNLAACNLDIAIKEAMRDMSKIPATEVNIDTLKRTMRKMREMYKKDRADAFTKTFKAHCVSLVKKATSIIVAHEALMNLK